MENGPFIDDFPIKTSIYEGFSMAMLNKQMVSRPCPNISYCDRHVFFYQNFPLQVACAASNQSFEQVGETAKRIELTMTGIQWGYHGYMMGI